MTTKPAILQALHVSTNKYKVRLTQNIMFEFYSTI